MTLTEQRRQQDERIRYLTATLEIRASYGTTASPDGYTSAGSEDPGGKRPAGGDTAPQHDALRAEYIACLTPEGRDRVIGDAERAVNRVHWRITNAGERRPEQRTSATDKDIVIEDGIGLTPAECEQKWGHPAFVVRRWRIAAQRNALTGTTAEPELTADEARKLAKARQYMAEGHTQRQSAMLSGVHRTTLRRALGHAA